MRSLLWPNLGELYPPAKPIGTPFIELQQVESTNNYAMGMVHARMAQHGLCVFAHHQTKGKGQRDRQWHSVAGQNLILSVIVAPFGLAPSGQFGLSMATAIGVYRFFNHYAGDDTAIKWPNDLYWRDRKAGGILIENVLQGHQWQWAVVGMGININQTQFPGVERKTVSLKQITGKTFDPVVLAHELAGYLQTAFDELHNAPQELAATYHQALYRQGLPTRFKQGSRIFTGVVTGVAPTGELLVQTGVEERFGLGEIEWLE